MSLARMSRATLLAAFLGAIFPAAFAFLFFEASLFDLTASFRLESFAA